MSNLLNKDYINTFKLLKERILKAQYKSYSAVNSEMIFAYLDIGKIISEKMMIVNLPFTFFIIS